MRSLLILYRALLISTVHSSKLNIQNYLEKYTVPLDYWIIFFLLILKKKIKKSILRVKMVIKIIKYLGINQGAKTTKH